jgi:2-C-methyl-D-erythritol 4-phosphate cytidylyltransferase
MVTALVVAAGRSRRMAGLGDKVLLPLHGRPLIAQTLHPFCRSRLVDQIVLVTAADLLPGMRQTVDKFGLSKVSSIVVGGESRQDSVRIGLEHLPAGTQFVAIHDGARPCLTEQLLERVLRVGMAHGAAILAVPVKDTLKRVVGGVEVETPDRSQFFAAQTPQVFRYDWVLHSHRQAVVDGLSATDDAALLTAYGRVVQIVPGAYTNIKVTTPDDLPVAELMLARRNEF